MEQLLADYQEINGRLSALQDGEEKAQLYVDLIELINRIADYVIPGDNPSRERIGDVMGGQILVLRSERLREEGREEGRDRGAHGRTGRRAYFRIMLHGSGRRYIPGTCGKASGNYCAGSGAEDDGFRIPVSEAVERSHN